MAVAETLTKGFSDPVHDAQLVFRKVLTAMSRPGTVVELDVPETVAPLDGAAMALCLALLDFETPLWLAPGVGRQAAEVIRFHSGCPLAGDPSEAVFALIDQAAELPPLSRFAPGEEAYPDRSTTLIVQVEWLNAGEGVPMQGPGIRGRARLDCPLFTEDFLLEWNDNHSRFPLGVDMLLTCGERLAALPRTLLLGD